MVPAGTPVLVALGMTLSSAAANPAADAVPATDNAAVRADVGAVIAGIDASEVPVTAVSEELPPAPGSAAVVGAFVPGTESTGVVSTGAAAVLAAVVDSMGAAAAGETPVSVPAVMMDAAASAERAKVWPRGRDRRTAGAGFVKILGSVSLKLDVEIPPGVAVRKAKKWLSSRRMSSHRASRRAKHRLDSPRLTNVSELTHPKWGPVRGSFAREDISYQGYSPGERPAHRGPGECEWGAEKMPPPGA